MSSSSSSSSQSPTNTTLSSTNEEAVNKCFFNFTKVLVSLLIIVLNLYVVILFLRIKKRTVSICLFVSIALSDLLIGLMNVLLDAFSSINGYKWPFGVTMCFIHSFFKQYNFMVTDDTVFLLAWHRYLQLNLPFRQSEQLNRKRVLIILSPWIYRAIYCALSLVLINSYGGIVLNACLTIYTGLHIFIAIFFIELPIATTAIVVNALNIYKIIKKNKRLVGKLKSIEASNTLENNGTERRNLSVDDPLELRKASKIPTTKTPTTEKSDGVADEITEEEIDSAMINSKNKKRVERRLTKSFNRDIKAILCISSMILNMLLTNHSFFIIFTYVFICNCRLYLIEYSLFVASLYPLINPLLMIIFNSRLKKKD